MGKEIERKWLISQKDFEENIEPSPRVGVFYEQGYLSDDPNATVRVRNLGNMFGKITVKGKNVGLTRPEYEYNIPVEDAKEMLAMCPTVLKKSRYIRDFGHIHKFEIDVFHGDLEGLIIAELELESEDQVVEVPSFFGEEVSDDPRYYNSNLIKNGIPTREKEKEKYRRDFNNLLASTTRNHISTCPNISDGVREDLLRRIDGEDYE